MKRRIFQILSILIVLALLIILGGNANAFDQAFVYLPINYLHHCLDFYDDFSDQTSGWFVGEDETARFEYLKGEYRILSKDIHDNYSEAPTCAREDYTLEVEARWVGTPGESYGIYFRKENSEVFYLFKVNSVDQEYSFWKYDGENFFLVISGFSNHINSGNYSNHLMMSKNENEISHWINGVKLGTWSAKYYVKDSFVGIYSSANIDSPISDARFDNFSITN